MNLLELITARAAKLGEMQALNDAHATMTDEISAQYEGLHSEFKKLNRDVEIAKTENKLAGEVDDVLLAGNIDQATAQADYRNGFDSYLSGQNLDEAMAAMTEGVDADGGYTVPESYQNTVRTKLSILGRTRSISSVLPTASTTNIPTEGEAPTFAWIDEGADYGETKSTFGSKKMGAHKLGGIIKVSRELLQDTLINFDSYMALQIAKGIDKAEAPAFAIGTVIAASPTGYAVSAPVGASSTTAAVAAVTADEIIDIYYDLKEEYRANATWRMHDSTLKALDKLKDGQGNYILTSLKDGTVNIIKGRPVVVDNSMAPLGAGNVFIVLGDFSNYEIGDRGAMTVQRLDELYAGKGLVGFQVTVRVDGKVIIEEAFNAGKNAAV